MVSELDLYSSKSLDIAGNAIWSASPSLQYRASTEGPEYFQCMVRKEGSNGTTDDIAIQLFDLGQVVEPPADEVSWRVPYSHGGRSGVTCRPLRGGSDLPPGQPELRTSAQSEVLLSVRTRLPTAATFATPLPLGL